MKPEEYKSAAETDYTGVREPPHKFVWILVCLVFLIGAGCGTAVYYYKQSANSNTSLDADALSFLELPEMIVALDRAGHKPSFVRLNIRLQVEGKKNIDTVKKWLPKIQDVIYTYTHELKEEDLRGSIGLYRLRRELILRVNDVVAPAKVDDILFKSFIIE